MPRSDLPDPALRPPTVVVPSVRVADAGGRVSTLPSIPELACLAGIWLCLVVEYFCETLGAGNLGTREWCPTPERDAFHHERRRGGGGAARAERSRDAEPLTP